MLPRLLRKIFALSTWFIVIIAGVSAVAALYLVLAVYEVKTIQIIALPEVTIVGLEPLKHRFTPLIKTKEVEKELRDANPNIQNISVTVQLPSTLIITTKPRVPLALFQVDGGFFVLGGDATIIRKTRTPEHYPIIHYYQKFGYQSYQPGDSLHFSDVSTALYFLQLALDFGVPIDNIDIEGMYMIRLYGNDREILVSADKDKALTEYQFTTIIRQFKIEGKQFKRLDLRFDKPIVVLIQEK